MKIRTLPGQREKKAGWRRSIQVPGFAVKAHDFDRLRAKGLELDPELEGDPVFFRPGPGKRATADGIQPRPVQRKASGHSSTGTVDPTRSPGEPLPEEVRRRMERAFGADFSEVRIQVGPEAAAVGAKAFTQGTEIHFATGEYDPSSALGLELVGQVLTHVIQQAQGRVAETG